MLTAPRLQALILSKKPRRLEESLGLNSGWETLTTSSQENVGVEEATPAETAVEAETERRFEGFIGRAIGEWKSGNEAIKLPGNGRGDRAARKDEIEGRNLAVQQLAIEVPPAKLAIGGGGRDGKWMDCRRRETVKKPLQTTPLNKRVWNKIIVLY